MKQNKNLIYILRIIVTAVIICILFWVALTGSEQLLQGLIGILIISFIVNLLNQLHFN